LLPDFSSPADKFKEKEGWFSKIVFNLLFLYLHPLIAKLYFI